MQAQVSSEIIISVKPIKTTSPTLKEKTISTNYLEIKNQICKDTFHIGC